MTGKQQLVPATADALDPEAFAVGGSFVQRRLRRLRNSRVLRRFASDRVGQLAVVVLVLLTLVAVFHSWLEPYDPLRQDLSNIGAGPSGAHLLGTDHLGRDVLSRLIAGTAVTLWTAVLGTAVGMVGIPLGLLAGYFRGPFDAISSRIADGLLSIPPLLFAFGIIGFLGRGELNAALALGIVSAPRFFRVARTVATSVAEEPYMESSRAAGCSTARLLFGHVIPNASGPLLVLTSQTAGIVVTVQAGLALLGLGPEPPKPSWGGMLSDAFSQFSDEIFPMVPPAFMIVVLILCFFTLGDTIRDAFGRSKKH
ncbi:ABC transporter permease [Nocardioides sp.]|uniref:ABC transporter permease n=1 Tax=Nocardioides sp. TaxID=35761 RepID=UPI003D0DAA18